MRFSLRAGTIGAAAAAVLALPMTQAVAAGTPHSTPMQRAKVSTHLERRNLQQTFICLKNTSNRCLDWPSNATQLQVDDGHWYYAEVVGTVSNSNATPFTPGTGWNSRYNGNKVLALVPGGNLGDCTVDAPGSLPDQVFDYSPNGCGGLGNDRATQQTEWVVSGGYLINVDATSGLDSSGAPAVLNAGCLNKGCNVWVTKADQVNDANKNWGYNSSS